MKMGKGCIELIISYNLGNSLYINLTNRCSNSCDFCLRASKGQPEIDSNKWETSDDLSGTSELWLDYEPEVSEIIEDLSKRDLKSYDEIVFCGFGEPFMRFYDCLEIAKWLREQQVKKIRVNTNGQANLIFDTDVTPLMAGLFDVVSVSLNNKNAKEYDATCHSDFGEKAYDGLLEFGEKCAKLGIRTVFSVVDILPKEDIEVCRKLATDRGCELRVREYIE